MNKRNLTQISLIITALVIAAVGVVAFVSIGDFNDGFSEKQTNEIRNTVAEYVAQCYALEGAYPPDLEYLEDNYGLQLDKDKYIYHYEMFATNIFPDVRVFAKQKDGD